MATIYIVVSWVDHHARDKAGRAATREYGSASTKQAAIRLAEKVLPPDADYIITTVHQTVHEGRTPKIQRDLGRGL
jgi:nicotinamide riboside kinase